MTEAPDIRERLQVPALERREDLLDRLDVIEVLEPLEARTAGPARAQADRLSFCR